MKKNYTIYVSGNRNQRWIVKEIIHKYVDGHVYSDPEFHEVGRSEYKDGTTKIHYFEGAYYDFNTKRSVFKKLLKELKVIGLVINSVDNSTICISF